MIEFIVKNLGTIIVAVVTLSVIIAAIVYMIRNKKKGKSSCGCGCSSCPMSDSCHKSK